MAKMSRVSLILLFIAIIYPSDAQNVSEVVAAAGARVELRCGLRAEQRALWRRDGLEVGGEEARGELAGPGGLTAWLRLTAAPELAGLYTCASPPAHAVRLRVSAEESSTTTAPEEEWPELWYDLPRAIIINCSLGADATWSKDGAEVSAVPLLRERHAVRAEGERSVLEVRAKSSEDDWGTYTCAAGGRVAGWRVRARPVLRLPADAGAVEGQKLRLVCRVLGKPRAAVSWTYRNESLNETEVGAALGADRVRLAESAAGAAGAELVVAAARREDAGVYSCRAAGGGAEVAAEVTVRVKDMYAALWPFLGICAEVLLLCAVILVYERRRAKPAADPDDADQKKS